MSQFLLPRWAACSLGLVLACQASAAAPAYSLPNSAQYQLTSRTGLDYQIMVSWPEGTPPASGYPVVYLLDGNAIFGTVTETARRIAPPPGSLRQGLPAPLVVAIGYPGVIGTARERRILDYTPPLYGRPEIEGQGGAQVFLDFIQGQLKPFIEQHYSVDRRRQVLMGHSLGGLFTLYALFTRPSAFQDYVAVSPSLWWQDGALQAYADGFPQVWGEPASGARLFVSLGEFEQGPRSVPQGQTQSHAEQLVRRLQRAGLSGLAVDFRLHPGENHGSVASVGLARGLAQALRAEAP